MSGPTTLLERHSRVTPLGVRFWDDAAHVAVAQLAVEVYSAGDPQRRATARPNRTGTFVAAAAAWRHATWSSSSAAAIRLLGVGATRPMSSR